MYIHLYESLDGNLVGQDGSNLVQSRPGSLTIFWSARLNRAQYPKIYKSTVSYKYTKAQYPKTYKSKVH